MNALNQPIVAACDSEPDDAPDPVVECAERHARMLARLGEIGMQLAEEMAAAPKAEDRSPGESAMVFSRLTRALRLTMTLEMKVCEDLKRLHAGLELKRTERAEARAAAEYHDANAGLNAMEDSVREVVRVTVKAHTTDKDEREGFFDELDEWLKDETEDDDLYNRPIGESIALICKEFEITPDWDRWSAEPWAIEEMETKAEGSPYADWPIADPETDDPPGGALPTFSRREKEGPAP